VSASVWPTVHCHCRTVSHDSPPLRGGRREDSSDSDSDREQKKKKKDKKDKKDKKKKKARHPVFWGQGHSGLAHRLRPQDKKKDKKHKKKKGGDGPTRYSEMGFGAGGTTRPRLCRAHCCFSLSQDRTVPRMRKGTRS
jgi:hypothetical protein